MIRQLGNENYALSIDVKACGMAIAGGTFGDITLLPAPIFRMRLKNTKNNEELHVDSVSGWEKANIKERGTRVEFIFDGWKEVPDVCVIVEADLSEKTVKWTAEVMNDNQEYSVMDITYPTPKITASYFNLFTPGHSGNVTENAGKQVINESFCYPGSGLSMQYFAMYGKDTGIYVATEDGKAATKKFEWVCENDVLELIVTFPAIGAGLPANSFALYGTCNWSFFSGDWYDATQLYADFVQREAEWLPEIGINGREDISERFKKVPFWISDYIPNTESQGDNKPMNLSAGSDIYEKDYWYKAPMKLQEELGVPIAYHVYNWHEIPFNIEYPHFMPAKQEFVEHIEELQKHDIYVLPYINAVSWEMNDEEGEHEVTFANTGCHQAVQNEDGTYHVTDYPQHTRSGEVSHLAGVCGSSAVWHRMMETLTRQIESELNVDGVYFDEVAAHAAYPCYSTKHNHLPGGGTYYTDGYNSMMKKINANKPEDNFYFTECNAEAYMKNFDGYLTWTWVGSGQVPAFATVYAGYIQLFGRCTIGNKKDDFEFFKYCTAQSFLCGQQLGWCKADIVYSPKHMEFLKQIVEKRYQYTHVFHSCRLMRPPVVRTSVPKLVTSAGLWFQGDVVSEQVVAAGWRSRTEDKRYLFAINLSEEPVSYSMSLRAEEYGLSEINGELDKYEIKVWEL